MRNLPKILLLMLLSILLLGGNAAAFDLGTNITIFDGVGNALENEDGTVEPYCVWDQNWDLEGFFINGTTLYIVGGYDFVNGYGGYAPGDLFFDTNGDAIYGASNSGSGSGNVVVANDFGYDYVLDFNDASMSYSVYALSNASTVTVYYGQNDESNPWRYDSGGTIIGSGTASYETVTDLQVAGAGLAGGIHNVVGIDISFLPVGFFLAHYTYECGNDNLIGTVPEPSNMFLLGTGLLGLVAVGRKRYFK